MLLLAGRGCACAAFGRALLPSAPRLQCNQLRAGASKVTAAGGAPSTPVREEETSLAGPSPAASSGPSASPRPRTKPTENPSLRTRGPPHTQEPQPQPQTRSKPRRAAANLEPQRSTQGPPGPNPASPPPSPASRNGNDPTPTPSAPATPAHPPPSPPPTPQSPSPTSSSSPSPASSSSPSPTANTASSAPAAAAAAGDLGAQLSPQQHRQLETYLDYMLEVNKSMNLTAVRDRSDAWQRHVLDSLALLPLIERHAQPAAPAAADPTAPTADGRAAASGQQAGAAAADDDDREEGTKGGQQAGSSSSGDGSSGSSDGSGGGSLAGLRLVDVGTGAGLPGMVLAAARPQWKVTLLDSLRKRCDFLREAAERAGLSNVEVVWCRAEEGGQRPELRQAYDVAVARAVAEARVLAELCLPFVRVGGLWVAAKGPNPEEEAAAAAAAVRQLGGSPIQVVRVSSHSSEGQRTALLVTKRAPTPPRFPRQPGTPSKKPL